MRATEATSEHIYLSTILHAYIIYCVLSFICHTFIYKYTIQVFSSCFVIVLFVQFR